MPTGPAFQGRHEGVASPSLGGRVDPIAVIAAVLVALSLSCGSLPGPAAPCRVPGVNQRTCSESLDADCYVAFGDSITRGMGDDDPADGWGYAGALEALLNTDGERPVQVVEKGRVNTQSSWGAENVGRVLDENPGAEIVLVLFGTNDARDGVHPETFGSNLESILQQIHNRGKKALLGTVPFARARYPGCDQAAPDELIRSYNDVIHGIYDGPYRPVLDLGQDPGCIVWPPSFYEHFRGQAAGENEMCDCVHPNAEGYRSMARLWRDALSGTCWPAAYPGLFEHAGDLGLLRRYRDQVLLATPAGERHAALLYAHSAELLATLLRNPGLVDRARRLVAGHRGEVRRVLAGSEGRIAVPGELLGFLEELAAASPPATRDALVQVRSEMLEHRREGRSFLGFRLGADE